MLLCKILLFLLGISLLVVSFSAFRLSPPIKAWIERALENTNLGLIELAETSSSEALRAFSIYFGSAAILALAIGMLGDIANLDVAVKNTFGVTGYALGYAALSIYAWNKRRQEILDELVSRAKQESMRYSKYFAFFSIFILMTAAAISALIGEAALSSFGPIALILFAGALALVATTVMANTISLVVVFGPALAAIVYLWVAIYVARGALVIGERRLVNFLVLYGVAGTLYFTVLGLPELRASLGLPILCR